MTSSNIIIKIDNRETTLAKQIEHYTNNIPSFKDITIIVENLPIGDIIIKYGEDEVLIIERKSISDLVSSIKDGRYEEQSFRLNGLNHHNHNIIYLIEGNINMQYNRFKEFNKLTIYSAIFSLNYYKGFSIMRTDNIEETAIFICNTANKLRKGFVENRKSFYCNNLQSDKQNNSDSIVENIETSEKDYVSVVKKVKKENVNVNNISEIMLCQIPGISSTTAIAVLSEFKNISNLINKIKENPDCLKNISYTNAKGQIRKINKTCISNIISFLLPEQNPTIQIDTEIK